VTRRYVLLSALVNLLFFGALELGLRAFGFQYSWFPRLMQQQAAEQRVAWQNQNRVLQHFIPDSQRMWRPEPGFGTVNALGYQGAPLPVGRTPMQRRVLFLGDSCTNSGPDQYPEKVVALLARSGIPVEPLIAGVGGYSTYQGLGFLREALAYNPDAVVAYFGWNDHWFAAAGIPDNEFRQLGGLQMLSLRVLSGLRIYQLIHYLIYPPRKADLGIPFEKLVESTRVPPAWFVDNVQSMIELTERRRIPILFVAPPYGATVVNPANDALFPASLIPRVHALYRDLLRATVARHTEAKLVDVSPLEFDVSLMRADGIHPTEAGYARIAEAVAQELLPLLRRTSPGVAESPEAFAGAVAAASR
jgi:lysophospholipase L1-like esterase